MEKIIFQLLSCLYLYDSGILVPVRLENKTGIPACDMPVVDIPCRRYTGIRRHREVCAKSVYRRATPQGSLRKAGIPASDVLRVNINKLTGECHHEAVWRRLLPMDALKTWTV